jgi:hypothetical protein
MEFGKHVTRRVQVEDLIEATREDGSNHFKQACLIKRYGGFALVSMGLEGAVKHVDFCGSLCTLILILQTLSLICIVC